VNCEEFRRKLHQNPACREPGFLAHRENCRRCGDEARQVVAMEARLRELLQSPPPADLKARLRQAPRKRRSGLIPAAIAASFAGLVALGTLWLGGAGESGGMVSEVLAHVAHEPQALKVSQPIREEDWRTLSARVRLDTTGWRHTVTYAAPCELMQEPGLHLVLASESGPVTVLVIVDRQVGQARMFSGEDLRGVLRPLRRGTLAVVGAEGGLVDAVAAELAGRIEIRI
jgi:hypothetical protein